ncbi:MAG: TIGR04282 family arsenosugar biosynthesis glycosyltransferase [Deltaproteobacteria bacterium]|nr:TIGR04282 family arsenosugar biosynthesis glycosyltransferase [Deltaproteobacteria bacterium]
MTSRAVAVMGKIPVPGRVKTRLAAALGDEAAARLYRAFLEDVFDVVEAARAEARPAGLDFAPFFSCALDGAADHAASVALAPPGFEIVAQGAGDLGERIEATRAATRADHAVIIGSDAPTMSPSRIVEALERLAATPAIDAVLGPTEDGGYDLIGLRGPEPGLLAGIPWSTPRVLAATRTAAARGGLRLAELAVGYDVDQPVDLARVFEDAGRPGSLARRTRTVLGALGLFP